MSNPWIKNIPQDFSIRKQPITTQTVAQNPTIVNYPLASTGFNSGSTYLETGGVSSEVVTSLNNLINDVELVSLNDNLVITQTGQNINFDVLNGGIGVETLNSLAGAVTISSTNGNLTITEVGDDIQLTVLSGGIGVESLESLAGNIGLTSTGGSVAITTVGNDINLEATVNVGVSSLESLTGAIGLTSTGSTVVITTVGNDINLETVGTTPVTDWSLYPAISNVNMANHNITSGGQMEIIVDAGTSPSISILDIIAQNGIGGRINMTANGGFGGTTYGSIDITANGGTTAGVTAGGSINIISNTPVGTSGSITGKVNINAAGINSYAGATPTLGSIAGYNFVHGDLAVNVTAGTPPIVPSDPLCVYLYGTNGTLMYGTQYMGRIRPYSDLTINPTDLTIEKYNNGFTTGYIIIDGCKTLNMEATASLSVSNGTGSNGQVLGKSGGNLAWVAGNTNSIPYTLSGTTGGGVIVNRGTGAGFTLPSGVFTVISTITFNLPATLNATDSVYYDGWFLGDFSANFNSFWGVSYFTNTFATETDIIGSTTTSANALNFSNIQQIYLPMNLIIPPTNITAGGTVTLKIYANATSTNHYLTIPPVNTARIGVVKD